MLYFTLAALAAFPFLLNGFVLIVLALVGISIWYHWHPGRLPQLGQVVFVHDGNTLALSPPDGGFLQIIRLANIDAPEIAHGASQPGQPYSQLATAMLATEVLYKAVTLNCYKRDRDSRAVCDVQRNGQSVNRMLVASGVAWVDRKQSSYMHESSMLALEATARAANLGLWAANYPPPVAPWLWRRRCWQEHQCASLSSNAHFTVHGEQ